MKYLIVFAHPNPASFSSSLIKALCDHLVNAGNEVELRDLYGIGFNPVLSADDFSSLADNKVPEDIATEQEYVKRAEHIIFVFPVWWGGMPAIMKGYIDRVLSEGFAYEYVDEGSNGNGLLSHLTCSMICATGLSSEDFQTAQDAMKVIAEGVICGFTGIKPGKQLFYGSVPTVSDEVRKSYIQEVIKEFSE
ncbi:MAG: NAD(P)H-dependent oxidoreductase [Prevotellaceae bacterium]|jgi:NAD(P)H dehydrogenase (quinone)|nr:NAD(P)H-dependent oxidoreductase [Prevotellaceae bacterium]